MPSVWLVFVAEYAQIRLLMLPSQVYFITKLHLTKGQPKNITFLPRNLSAVFVFEAHYATADELIADLLRH
jgi:hypothetical protein